MPSQEEPQHSAGNHTAARFFGRSKRKVRKHDGAWRMGIPGSSGPSADASGRAGNVWGIHPAVFWGWCPCFYHDGRHAHVFAGRSSMELVCREKNNGGRRSLCPLMRCFKTKLLHWRGWRRGSVHGYERLQIRRQFPEPLWNTLERYPSGIGIPYTDHGYDKGYKGP